MRADATIPIMSARAQVSYLRDEKNVSFELMGEEDAVAFLEERSFFFKLKAFAKTKNLKPGESETVTLKVKAADLASFDEAASAWVVAEGEYQFLVAASAQDVKATLPAAVKASTAKVNDVLKPQAPLNLLKR